MREARNRCRAIVGVGIFAEQNDDDGTGPPHVPPTLVSSQRVERLSRVIVRGLWTAQQTARPQPASRGRRTHRVRALESAERNFGTSRGLAARSMSGRRTRRPDFGSQKLTSEGRRTPQSQGAPSRFARMSKGDDTETRPTPPGRSASEPSSASSPDGKTDFGELPMSNEAFESLRSAVSASEYARANRPYAPLPEGESAPTMAQLWAYAHRRYARFQGYAWGGVVIVGAVAWGASRVAGAGEGRKKSHAKTRA